MIRPSHIVKLKQGPCLVAFLGSQTTHDVVTVVGALFFYLHDNKETHFDNDGVCVFCNSEGPGKVRHRFFLKEFLGAPACAPWINILAHLRVEPQPAAFFES